MRNCERTPEPKTMSNAYSKGYGIDNPPASEPETFQLFKNNLDFLRSRKEDILRSGDYYFVELSFAYASWPYIPGDGPLYLGMLLIGWDMGALVDHCAECGSKVLIYRISGSPLSGSNSYSGICTGTIKDVIGGESKEFIDRVNFICTLRRYAVLELKEKEQYLGQKFSFGGTGLEPAIKEKVVTRQLANPVSLEVLLNELKNNKARTTNPLKISELPGDLKLKFSK